MTKKEGFNNWMFIYGIAILITVISITLGFFYHGNFYSSDFNSEYHVCLNGQKPNLNGTGPYFTMETIGEFTKGKMELDFFEKKYNSKYNTHIENCEWIESPYRVEGIVVCNSCWNWRDKTKCDLNSETEGCICDEYDYKLPRSFIINNKEVYDNNISKFIQTKNNCIRSHPRTILDYDCDTLKRQIWFNEDYNIKKDSFESCARISKLCIQTSKLRQIYLENGCEI